MLEFHKYFHWLYYAQNKRHIFNIGTGLFIWLFLVSTQGFGIYHHNLSNFFLLTLYLSTFGLIWIAVIYLIDFIATSLIRIDLTNNSKADLFVWISKLIVNIHISLLYRDFLCDWQCVNAGEYFESCIAYTLMSLLFYIPFSLYGRFNFFQQLVGKNENESSLFALKGEGKKVLKVNLDDLVYFMADDNYVDVMIRTPEGKMFKEIIRVSIKSLEDQLKDKNQFIRIHRKYLVNLQFLAGVDKDAVSLVYAEGVPSVEIPISEKYKEGLLKLIP